MGCRLFYTVCLFLYSDRYDQKAWVQKLTDFFRHYSDAVKCLFAIILAALHTGCAQFK